MPVDAQTMSLNAGFVIGVWYSEEPFFAGETVRIYTGLQNQSGFDIIGRVEFLDGEKIIGASDFSAINGRLIEKWFDWKVTEGNHAVSVRIVEPKKSVAGKPPEPVTLRFNTAAADEQFADLDTDGDRIGNLEDPDDDNDGVSDDVEAAQKTNPLKNDMDGDGLSDARDPQPRSAGTSDQKAIAASPTPGSQAADDAVIGDKEQGPVGSIIERINNFAEAQKAKIDAKRARLRQVITAGGDGGLVPLAENTTITPKTESGQEPVVTIDQGPVRSLYLAALAVASFTLGHKMALYLFLFFAALIFVRLLWRLFRSAEYE